MDKSEFYDFMLSVITDMERQGRYSTAHVYHCALKSAVKYGGHSLHMEDLTPGWLQSYQEYLLRQSLLWNTISTYMRMLRAVRDRRKFATQADMEESIEVVIAGYQKKSRVLSEKEKLIVSYHEIGHALVAAMQTNSAPVHKITIIPRTSGALGYTMQVEDGEHYLMSKEELENKIATSTGGRAAEELIFHSITTGASNDIEQATKLARGMITRYGMSDDFDMVAMESVQNQYLGGDTSLACSFETQTEIDKKVVELVKTQHAKAYKILEDNIGKLHQLAKYLYDNETITGEEFMKILAEPMPQIGAEE